MKTVVLITSSYPYGAVTERTFVEPEIEALAERFDRVVVMPMIRKGERTMSALPANVEVSDLWLDHVDRGSKWWRLRHVPTAEFFRLTRGQLTDLTTVKYVLSAIEFADALPYFVKSLGLDLKQTVFYTFWFEYTTDALGLARQRGMDVTYVSRCHNHDIYTPIAHVSRAQAIAQSQGLYDVSLAGAGYMRKTFPQQADKVKSVILGSIKAYPEDINPAKGSGDTLTFYSCSRVEPVKRVALNLEMLRHLAQTMPETKIEWIHAGGGSLLETLRKDASALPPNLTVSILGELSNRDAQRIFCDRHIDAFVLLSTLEGLPIAICEALSYGVPVIATDAGGTGEIVNDKVGKLLPVDLTTGDFCKAVSHVVDGGEEMRQTAINVWKEKYDGNATRRLFAEEISKL